MPGRPRNPRRGGDDDPLIRPTGRYQLPPPEDPGHKGLYRPNRRMLYGLLIILGVVAVGRAILASNHDGINPLKTSCTTPAVALLDTTVGPGDALGVVVVGPSEDAYSVYLDVAAVRTGTDGKPVGVPENGRSADQTQLLFSTSTLPGCRAEGNPVLNLQIKPGPHRVTLLRHDVDGAQTLVASTPLTIR